MNSAQEQNIDTNTIAEVKNEPDKSELQTYREGVQGLYEVKSDKVITNGKAGHAAILFETFFKYAQKRVRIFCRNLNAEVFSNPRLLDEFKKATSQRNIFVNICYQEEPQPSEFLNLARTCANVKVRKAPPGSETFDSNFATMDDTSIRVEPKRDTFNAKAIMYAPEIAAKWNAMFDKLTAA